jgi:hypothetical protein
LDAAAVVVPPGLTGEALLATAAAPALIVVPLVAVDELAGAAGEAALATAGAAAEAAGGWLAPVAAPAVVAGEDGAGALLYRVAWAPSVAMVAPEASAPAALG